MIASAGVCGCAKNVPILPVFPAAERGLRPSTGQSSIGCCSAGEDSSLFSSPPWTPLSKNDGAPWSRPATGLSECQRKEPQGLAKSATRKPFENPLILARGSKEDGAKCPCPRLGETRYESMRGKCSPCCAGVEPRREKVVSEIVAGGKPYKEIEAVINENRMVVRVQREPVEPLWDPSCDCLDDRVANMPGRLAGGGCEGQGKRTAAKQCGDNVVFRMADGCKGGGGEDRRNLDASCRTIEVFPQPEETSREPSREVKNENSKDSKKENKNGKPTVVPRFVDLEDNPNIFVLRIRKRSENAERKNNIDLEFRTPRPWRHPPKPSNSPSSSPPPPPLPNTPNEEKSDKGKRGGKQKKGKK